MTLDELVTPKTADEIKAEIYVEIEALGIDTTVWIPGSPTRTIIAVLSVVLAAFSSLIAAIAGAGFLDLSTGDWLTLVARYVYGVERDLGSFATGNVVLDNTGGGVYAGDPGDLIVRHEDTGKTYRNTAAFTLNALQTGVVVPVQAVEIGSASNAAANKITEFETVLLGVNVTNPAGLVGNDPQTDEELRQLCKEKQGALSPNGPWDAYSFVAKQATRQDGSKVGVTRVRTVPDGVGGVDVYVATGSGGVTGTAGDPSTDLGAVADAIHTLVEPLAVTPTVQSATVTTIAVTYEAWIHDTSGKTEAEWEAEIEAALTAYLAVQPIGGVHKPATVGRIYKQALEAVIDDTVGSLLMVDLSVTVPAGNTNLTISQAPVVGVVTPTIHLITETNG